jgi:hypothetical protein
VKNFIPTAAQAKRVLRSARSVALAAVLTTGVAPSAFADLMVYITPPYFSFAPVGSNGNYFQQIPDGYTDTVDLAVWKLVFDQSTDQNYNATIYIDGSIGNASQNFVIQPVSPGIAIEGAFVFPDIYFNSSLSGEIQITIVGDPNPIIETGYASFVQLFTDPYAETASVAEPSSLAILAASLGIAGWWYRRKSQSELTTPARSAKNFVPVALAFGAVSLAMPARRLSFQDRPSCSRHDFVSSKSSFKSFWIAARRSDGISPAF